MRNFENVKLVELCDREDLLIQSCNFLNSEWPRNMDYREYWQRKSCRPSPPMSFLLLDTEKDEIIGHAGLCLLPSWPKFLYLESVLIAKDRRRRGLGTYMMSEVENWMASNGFERAYLSTEDQCGFYESIGYQKCDPTALVDFKAPTDDEKFQYLTKRIGRM